MFLSEYIIVRDKNMLKYSRRLVCMDGHTGALPDMNGSSRRICSIRKHIYQ